MTTCLDAAILKRPGRLDRAVQFRNPDRDLRREHYQRLGPTLTGDQSEIAIERTEGFSFAQLRETRLRKQDCAQASSFPIRPPPAAALKVTSRDSLIFACPWRRIGLTGKKPEGGYWHDANLHDIKGPKAGVRIKLSREDPVAHVIVKLGKIPAHLTVNISDRNTGKAVELATVRWIVN
jgi:hypothetical protein